MGYPKKTEATKITIVYTIFLFFPVVLLICVHPFVTHYKLYESRLSEFAWTPSNPWATDFYLYYKQIFFVIIAGISSLLFIFLLFRYKKSGELAKLRTQKNMLIPLGIYLVLTLLSSIFSEYKWISFIGSDGQFESTFVILGYILCCFYLVLLIRTNQDLKIIEIIIWILLGLSALLGVLQFTGNDPLGWEWFQRLITPKGYLESGGTITSIFEENRVSLFAYNPNYAGVLLALLSGICFGLLITESNSRKRILEAILLLCLLIGLVGTSSKAGLLTFLAVATLSLVFMRRKIKKFNYILAAFGTVSILGVILLFTVGSNLPLTIQIKQLITFEKLESNPLQQMVTEKDKVLFTYRNTSFSVTFDYENGGFDFTVTSDNTDIPLRLSENREVYYLEHENLEDVTIRPGIIDDTLPVFVITLNGREWMFVKAEQQYYYLNQYLRLEELQNVERIGFVGHENFATYRGLIWSMTLPLLKDTLLLGTGADTFACYYPQNNYKDLYYYTGDATASSRPHSMYLKIAVESGAIALIALLVFWGWYWLQSIKIYWKEDFSSLSARIGFACFIAVTIYLICGLTNDSMITVAPIFWCIQGVGLAANWMSRK